MDECQNEIDFEELEKLCSSVSDDADTFSMGQSESKKASKKASAGLETKGTAMSFGFKKHKIPQTGGTHKLSGGPVSGTDGTNGSGPATGGTFTRKSGVINGNNLYGGGFEKEKATERDNATVISNPGVEGIFSDKNGNMGSTDTIDDGTGKPNGRSTPRLQPPKKDAYGAPYRNNRFGFRTSNVVRPASVGLQPKSIGDYDKQHSTNVNNNNNNRTNNNNNVYITDKRRSKSASSATATARTTFTPLQQVPSQIQQERASALPHHAIGALQKPLPKYQSANGATKITSSDSDSANGSQQVMTKCDQAEHKNTSQNASVALNGGCWDDQQHQSNVNNSNGRQYVSSVANTAQHHAASNAITKIGSKTAAANNQETASVAKFTLHSSSLPKPQYPVPISLSSANPRYDMDSKGAKQAVNISRKGTMQGNQQIYQREPSPDQLSDLNPNVDTTSNIRMPRLRYRSLEMVMSGRHKFEVRDLETLTAEPIVSLALPKLPDSFNSDGQPQPIGMSGLVRSSELPRQLSDDIDINDNRYESEQAPMERKDSIVSSDLESLEEEKLTRDNNSSEKSLKGAIIKDLIESHCSKVSSPGSSRASWCNAGETMAAKDCSSFSLSSDESNANPQLRDKKRFVEEEDISSVTITAGNPSFMSSISGAVPMDISVNLDSISEPQNNLSDEPDNNGIFRTEETKFAEIAAAVGDNLLLDDETSPTDSLVSSCTDSDDARKNRKKATEPKLDKIEKEKDIDEISPELDELTSPVTPGTPTHASNSLSLSDVGRDFLIDDEIADQPELVFDEPALNDSSMVDLGSIHINITDDAATLRDSLSSLNNNKIASKSAAPVPKPRKIMSDIYESPASIRKNRTRLSRAESLDTLSPCDSIASDDYMLDFNSSMDSIDRPLRSTASGSASALHSMHELQLWSELETKGGTLMHEWSKLLRQTQRSNNNNNNNTSRESITSQLPTRATRLLTRRLQNNATPTNCGIGGSDSPRSMDSLPRRTGLSAAYKTATLNQFNGMNNNNNISNNNLDSISTATNSAEDLTLLDKSLRNTMLQDVVHFKKQLVRLRRILQETDTLNPFENNNGQFFTTATAATTATTTTTADATALPDGGAPASGASICSVDSKQQENLLIKESGVVALALLEDQRQELADLRRQVVYLQGEMTAKDRTIRQQQNLIEKYEAEREKLQAGLPTAPDGSTGDSSNDKTIDTISTATQTERLRPLSFGGPEGLASRSEPSTPLPGPPPRNGLRSPATANSNHHHQHHHHNHIPNGGTSPAAMINSSRTSLNLKPKTQISSVYTQLSSIKHSNYNGPVSNAALATLSHKRSSLGSSGNLSNIPTTGGSGGAPTKTVRTTHIGNVLTSSKFHQANSSPTSTSSSQPPTANGTKLLKSSVRTQFNGGNSASPTKVSAVSPRRTSAIKPPSSFGNNAFPDTPPTSHKSKSAPVTPMIERVSSSPQQACGVQIVIEKGDNVIKPVSVKENGFYGPQNGCPQAQQPDDGNNNKRNGQPESDDGDYKETEKDAINSKINSVKLANGLTGCNDTSSSKESSLVI